MQPRRVSLAIYSIGAILLLYSAYLTWSPDAFMEPQQFVTIGVGSAFIVVGGVSVLAGRNPHAWSFQRVYRSSLLTVPLAFAFYSILTYIGNPPVQTPIRLLWFFALQAGYSILFYPIAFAFAAGYSKNTQTRALTKAGLLYIVGLGALFWWFLHPNRSYHSGFVIVGYVVIVVIVAIFSIPAYYHGRRLRPDSFLPD